MQRLWIPGPLPGLNDIVEANKLEGVRRSSGKGWKLRPGQFKGTYSEMKAMWKMDISHMARQQRIQPIDGKYFTYLCFEPHRRRDPSNVFGGAIKVIEDALQTCGTCGGSPCCITACPRPSRLLPGDGQKDVYEIRPHLVVRPGSPGVSVFVGSVTLTKEQALLLDNEGARNGHGQRTESNGTSGARDSEAE